MTLRWRKSFKIAPGLRLNLSHRGARLQIGSSPLSFSIPLLGGSRDKRLTASLPGTGLSFVHRVSSKRTAASGKLQIASVSTGHIVPAMNEAAQRDAIKGGFRQCVLEVLQARQPPIIREDLAEQPDEVMRVVFKTAAWNAALKAGLDLERNPFQINELLLALDEKDREGLVALATECFPPHPVWTTTGANTEGSQMPRKASDESNVASPSQSAPLRTAAVIMVVIFVVGLIAGRCSIG